MSNIMEIRARRDQAKQRYLERQEALSNLERELMEVVADFDSVPMSRYKEIRAKARDYAYMASCMGRPEHEYSQLKTQVEQLITVSVTAHNMAERDRSFRREEFVKTCEDYGRALATLREFGDGAGEFPTPAPAEPPTPEELADADLDRSPQLNMANNELRAGKITEARYTRALECMKDKLTAAERRNAIAALEAALAQVRAGIANAQATIDAFEAERDRRRKADERRQAAQAEAEALPDTIAELRRRLEQLEGVAQG